LYKDEETHKTLGSSNFGRMPNGIVRTNIAVYNEKNESYVYMILYNEDFKHSGVYDGNVF
jgi:hypothetical protein